MHFTTLFFSKVTLFFTSKFFTLACCWLLIVVSLNFSNLYAQSTCMSPTADVSADAENATLTVSILDVGISSEGNNYVINIENACVAPQTIIGIGDYIFDVSNSPNYELISISDGINTTCDVFIVYDDYEAMHNNCNCETVLRAGDFENSEDWEEIRVDGNGEILAIPIIQNDFSFEGDYAAYLGGIGDQENYLPPFQSSVRQSLKLPANSIISLSFSLFIEDYASAEDRFIVAIDSKIVYELDGTSLYCGDQSWHDITVDLSAYADGNSHNFSFNVIESGSSVARNSSSPPIRTFTAVLDYARIDACPCPENDICPVNYRQGDEDDDGFNAREPEFKAYCIQQLPNFPDPDTPTIYIPLILTSDCGNYCYVHTDLNANVLLDSNYNEVDCIPINTLFWIALTDEDIAATNGLLTIYSTSLGTCDYTSADTIDIKNLKLMYGYDRIEDACAFCMDNLTLGGAMQGTRSYKAEYATSSRQIIEVGANVDYRSGDCIYLGPTFEVEKGAEFRAIIQDCNDSIPNQIE